MLDRRRSPTRYIFLICEWLEAERPRERLIKLSAGALSDSELLAIFGYCLSGAVGSGPRTRINCSI